MPIFGNSSRIVCAASSPSVDDHEIRLAVANELDQLIRVAGLSDDLEVRSLEQAREPFAQENIVVGHDNATSDALLRCHPRLNLTPCLVAGTRRPLPTGCKEAHWSAIGAKARTAIFIG
jgi:hypothetical protein